MKKKDFNKNIERETYHETRENDRNPPIAKSHDLFIFSVIKSNRVMKKIRNYYKVVFLQNLNYILNTS